MSQPAPFHQAWLLEDTKSHLNLPPFPDAGNFAQQQAWRDEVWAPAQERLAGAIGRHIAWLMGEGKQVVPAFCEHVHLPLIQHLRAIEANPGGSEEQARAGERFANHTLVQVCFFQMNDEWLDPVSVHAKVVKAVEEGRFKLSGADMGADPVSGEILDVLFDNWAATAGRGRYIPIKDSFRKSYEFTPLSEFEVGEQAAEVVCLPVPSGELWVADWFRIQAFHDLCAPLDDDRDHDINTVGGRATRTRRYAQELGVGHVGCGSPSILQDEGVVKMGFLNPDAPSPASLKGEIRANLRWTTLVDRGHLVSLLEPILGLDEASRQVEDYAQSTPDLVRLQVEPGTHHLYFSGSALRFQETIGARFQAEGLYLEDFQEPAFVLTHAPLDPVLAAPRKLPRP